MQITSKSSFLVATFAVLISCGKTESISAEESVKYETPQEIAYAMLGELETLAKAINSARDIASANEAAEIIATLAPNFNALAAQLSTMDELSAEAKKELDAEMQKRMEKFQADHAPPNIAEINADEAEEIEKIMETAMEMLEASTRDAQPIFEDRLWPKEDNEDAPESEDDAPDE